METLFEIDSSLRECMEDGALNQEKIRGLNLGFENEVENLALWVRNLEEELNGVKNQKALFIKRQRDLERKLGNLKETLSDYLLGSRYSSSRVSVIPGVINDIIIENFEDIPEKFLMPPKIDEMKTRNYIKETGERVPGVYLQGRNTVSVA